MTFRAEAVLMRACLLAMLALCCGCYQAQRDGALTAKDYAIRDGDDGNDPGPYLSRAQSRLKLGLLDGALADCQVACAAVEKRIREHEYASETFEPYIVRAEVEVARHDYAAALASTDRATALDASEFQLDWTKQREVRIRIMTQRGHALCGLKRLDEAQAVAAELISGSARTLGEHAFPAGFALIQEVYASR